jgi:hypothetical protein
LTEKAVPLDSYVCVSLADPRSIIASLTAMSAALAAVALALIVVVPTLSAQVQTSSRKYAGQYFNRVFRLSFISLFGAVALLVASGTVGIAGLFWPSNCIAYAVGILSALGIVTLAVGAAGFALVTYRALLS